MSAKPGSADRILGCLLGGALGDAIGSAVEGQRPPVEFPSPERWSLTDDTQLTLATCEALLSKRSVSPEAIAERFVAWHSSRRLRGLGASTLKALTELAAGGHWALVGRGGEQAAGNGAAMRIAPLAFVLDAQVEDDRRMIRDVARITHRHDEACTGALAMVAAVRFAWREDSQGGSALLGHLRSVLPDTLVRDKLDELITAGDNRPLPELSAITGNSGYVVESASLAIVAAARVERIGFEEMITELISTGGDTDTIASMAGQIAGAMLGAEKLPAKWLDSLPQRSLIDSIAVPFAEVFAS